MGVFLKSLSPGTKFREIVDLEPGEKVTDLPIYIKLGAWDRRIKLTMESYYGSFPVLVLVVKRSSLMTMPEHALVEVVE